MMNIEGAMQLLRRFFDIVNLITLINVPIYQLPYELWTSLLIAQQKLKRIISNDMGINYNYK